MRWIPRGAGLLPAVSGLLLGAAAFAADLPAALGPRALAGDEPAAIALRQFGPRDGLMHSRIYALAQDVDGYVWAGTEAGVARYNGRRWEGLVLPGSEREGIPYVNNVLGTADGAVWIATDELGVLRYRDGHFDRLAFDPAQPGRPVQALARAGHDAVWAGGAAGLARCTVAGCTPLPGTAQLDVYVLANDTRDGRSVLWIGTVRDGLRRLDDAEQAAPRLSDFTLTAAQGLPASTVRALATFGGRDGRDLWIGTAQGLSRLSRDGLTVYDARSGLDTTAVASLAASRDARGQPVLYAGLLRGGLAEFHDDGSWRRVGTDRGLYDDNITSLLVTDTERATPRLWLGSKSSGVLRRDPGLWSTIDTTAGLPTRIITSLGETRFPDGVTRYWIGTGQGAVRRDSGTWQPFGPPPLDHAAIYDVAAALDGTLWIGTDSGLVHYAENRVDVIGRGVVGLAGDSVMGVLPRRADGADEVWFGTRHGAGRWRGGAVAALPGTPPDWIRHGIVRLFVAGPGAPGAERVWVAGDGGVAWYENASWHTLPEDCLAHREVFDLRVNPHAATPELWAATRRGVTRIRLAPTLACRSLTSPALPSPITYQVQFDHRGRVYAFGYQGVVRIDAGRASGGLDEAALDYYDLSDGLPALEFNRASFVDQAGRVWGGTIAGAAVFDPDEEPAPQAGKPLRLDAWRAGPEPQRVESGSELPYADASLRFDYTLLSFEREHRTRYRTELVGLEVAPSPWSTDSSVAYSRLPAGDYRFLVWARDALGTVSGPLEFGFRVAQPYWQRPWAIAGYALLLVLAGAGAGRWRARAIARRAQHLEREVRERTHALADANQRLAAASVTDPLTGLNNRRYFSERLAPELRALAGGDGDGVRLLCLVDIDHFKAINDQRGHAVGDRVLCRVAADLADAAGAAGSIASGAVLRWGGEEFLLVLPLAARAEAGVVVERLLARLRTACTEPLPPVTASIGWILWPLDHADAAHATLDAALSLADQALYRAKRSGRDRAEAARDGAGDANDGL